MICSECNKNNAEIFINKIENGVSSMEGLCHDCAKKRGIEIPDAPKTKSNKNAAQSGQTNVPPINNIDMTNMSKQLESLFKDLSSSLKIENLENMTGLSPEDMDEEYEDDENEENTLGMPIGSIFESIVEPFKNFRLCLAVFLNSSI